VTNKLDIWGLDSSNDHCYLHYSQLYSTPFEIMNGIDNLFTAICCSHRMSINGSSPITINLSPMGGLFGLQQHPDYNWGAAVNNPGHTLSKDTQFRQPTNRFHPSLGCRFPPSQPPFAGAPQFYHPAPFDVKPSSQPSSSRTQRKSESWAIVASL